MRNAIFSTSINSATRPRRGLPLRFTPVTAASIADIGKFAGCSGSMANDFTVGGIVMWADYFHYEYCIVDETLFIKGVSEVRPDLPAFSLPVGRMPLRQAVRLIVDYCHHEGVMPRFSAVPADRLEELLAATGGHAEELTDWADYIYDASALASLTGKKLGKKRNHVNRFVADNPGYRLEALSQLNIREAREAYLEWIGRDAGPALEAASAIEESAQTLGVMDGYGCFPFEGALLRDGSGRVVAFTVGEVVGDMLYTHIEKMNHEVAGAGEAINKFFAMMITERHQAVRYINREEDAGDEGLRRAKLSYQPAIILKKYDVTL